MYIVVNCCLELHLCDGLYLVWLAVTDNSLLELGSMCSFNLVFFS